jgi:2-phospho-L-lactate transferase/gluconeogenesis factor (CofD/UPF0052 family)
VATQHGETDDFGVSDHFRTLASHVGNNLFDYVLANDNVEGRCRTLALEAGDYRLTRVDGARVHTADVVSEANRYHHDSYKLAAAIMRLYSGRNEREPPEAWQRPARANGSVPAH